ncbi:MAG: hypothetical protein AAFW88_09415, partial [Pseudomonadota bacterium]
MPRVAFGAGPVTRRDAPPTVFAAAFGAVLGAAFDADLGDAFTAVFRVDFLAAAFFGALFFDAAFLLACNAAMSGRSRVTSWVPRSPRPDSDALVIKKSWMLKASSAACART